LQRHRTGSHHLSKEELITAAEASKLADVPIRGNANGWAEQRGAGKWYDGWSCVKVGGGGMRCLLLQLLWQGDASLRGGREGRKG
jgi:hypothetical protein